MSDTQGQSLFCKCVFGNHQHSWRVDGITQVDHIYYKEQQFKIDFLETSILRTEEEEDTLRKGKEQGVKECEENNCPPKLCPWSRESTESPLSTMTLMSDYFYNGDAVIGLLFSDTIKHSTYKPMLPTIIWKRKVALPPVLGVYDS